MGDGRFRLVAEVDGCGGGATAAVGECRRFSLDAVACGGTEIASIATSAEYCAYSM